MFTGLQVKPSCRSGFVILVHEAKLLSLAARFMWSTDELKGLWEKRAAEQEVVERLLLAVAQDDANCVKVGKERRGKERNWLHS
eukprot:scaffold196903_cov15-Tisochrysis_lutea.AAC.1